MKSIRFSHNWNGKLGLNRIFTTIRRVRSDEDYWGRKIGHIFKLDLRGGYMGKVRLIGARRVQFKDIMPELLMADTGTNSYEEAKGIFMRFYPNLKETDVFYLLLLEKMFGKGASDYEQEGRSNDLKNQGVGRL